MMRLFSVSAVAAIWVIGTWGSSFAEINVATPYAGQERREIKALAAEEVRALENGEGMGLAKAAELNRYPGPKHVLDLADKLELTPAQRVATQQLFTEMHTEAVSLGHDIVTAERELDAGFNAGNLTAEELDRLTQKLGMLSGRLRASHLKAHLKLRAILTDRQIAHYQVLRGYSAAPAGPAHEMEHMHHH